MILTVDSTVMEREGASQWKAEEMTDIWIENTYRILGFLGTWHLMLELTLLDKECGESSPIRQQCKRRGKLNVFLLVVIFSRKLESTVR